MQKRFQRFLFASILTALAASTGFAYQQKKLSNEQTAWLIKLGAAQLPEQSSIAQSVPTDQWQEILNIGFDTLPTDYSGEAQKRIPICRGLVVLARLKGDSSSLPTAFYTLGDVALVAQEWKISIEALNRAADLFAKVGDVKMEGRSRLNLYAALAGDTQFDLAYKESEKALGLLDQSKDWANQAILLISTSDALLRQGDVAKAQKNARAGIKIGEDHNDEELIAMGNLNLANTYVRQRDFESAKRSFSIASPYFEKTKRWTNLAACKTGLFNIYLSNMQYKEAQDVYEEAKQANQLAGDRRGSIINNLNYGAMLLQTGYYADAAPILLKSATETQSIDANSALIAYINYGSVLLEQGLYREAADAMGNALTMARDQHAIREEAGALAGIGSSLAALGQTANALSAYEEAFKKYPDIGLNPTIRLNLSFLRAISGKVDIGSTNLAYLQTFYQSSQSLEKKPAVALKSAEEFLASPSVVGIDSLEAVGLNMKGKALMRLGKRKEAYQYLHQSLAIYTRQRSRTADPLFASFSMRDSDSIAGNLIEVGHGIVPTNDLFEDIQSSGGAIIRRSLLSNNVISKGLPAEATNKLLQLFKASRESQKSSDLNAFLAYEAQLRILYPRSGDLSASPVSMTQIGSALGSNGIGIEYLVSDRHVFALCIANKNGKTLASIVDLPTNPATISSDVSLFNAKIANKQGRNDNEFVVLGKRLYSSLIAPIVKTFPEQSDLIFSLRGALSDLPLGALLDNKNRYLIESYSLTESASLSAWYASRQRAKHLDGLPARPLLLVGVSDFGKFTGTSLPNLTKVPEEVSAIKKIWKEQTVDLFEENATRKNLLSQFANAGAIHFATHAISDDRAPLSGAIVLWPSGSPSNAYLLARELTYMSIEAKYVVLSACSTASGIPSREGVLGIYWAFMVAGVPSLVASKWRVQDESSQSWVTVFYEGLTKGNSLSVSSQNACKSFIDRKDKLSSPYYWAGRTVYGSGQSISR